MVAVYGCLWWCCGVFVFLLSMMLCAFLVFLCGFLEIVVLPEWNLLLNGVFGGRENCLEVKDFPRKNYKENCARLFGVYGVFVFMLSVMLCAFFKVLCGFAVECGVWKVRKLIENIYIYIYIYIYFVLALQWFMPWANLEVDGLDSVITERKERRK